MNADVEKAVEYCRSNMGLINRRSEAEAILICQALRDKDAEIERLQNVSDGNAELYQHELLRTKEVEAKIAEHRAFFDLLRTGYYGKKYTCVLSRTGETHSVIEYLGEKP